nr:hypothetical protein [Pandoravirus massiliensis]
MISNQKKREEQQRKISLIVFLEKKGLPCMSPACCGSSFEGRALSCAVPHKGKKCKEPAEDTRSVTLLPRDPRPCMLAHLALPKCLFSYGFFSSLLRRQKTAPTGAFCLAARQARPFPSFSLFLLMICGCVRRIPFVSTRAGRLRRSAPIFLKKKRGEAGETTTQQR